MSKFINTVTVIWHGVRESLTSWIILCLVLLVLCIAFRCFTPPLKLARKRIRAVHERCTSLLPKRRNRNELEKDVPPQAVKELAKDAQSAMRLILAYAYDNGEDLRIKGLLIDMKKINNGIAAMRKESVQEDRKAMGSIMRNIEAQCTAAEEIIDAC